MIEIQKELKDISLPISEPEYRAMPELSYSTLSTYESLGFNGLDKLFEVKESPSLTFGSACDAISMLKERGCTNIRLMCLVSVPEGIKKVQSEHPDVDIYTAAVDDCLNDNAYIVPGLGDAGDRIFGTK
jgi:uracil phosphoribosyltransferase